MSADELKPRPARGERLRRALERRRGRLRALPGLTWLFSRRAAADESAQAPSAALLHAPAATRTLLPQSHLTPRQQAQKATRALLDAIATPQGLTTILMRVLSFFYLALTVELWAGLVGLSGASLSAMPVATQIVTVSFAVVYPVVAVSLWMAAPWGLVLWGMAAVVRLMVEIGLYERSILHPDALAMALLAVAFFALTVWRWRWEARHPASLPDIV